MFRIRNLTKLFARQIDKSLLQFGSKNVSTANNLVDNDMHLIYSTDDDLLHLMKSSLFVKENFLSIAEENNLFLEIEPILKKRRYEFDHWDNVKKDYFI